MRVIRLDDIPATGRGVRIAVIDSGAHVPHPHLARVAGGIAFDDSGAPGEDVADRLGHGTAVAAAIAEKAPEADIYAVKIFDRALSTTGAALRAALRWSIALPADIINVSLGTLDGDQAPALAALVADARAAGCLVVAAGEDAGRRWLPGCLPAVLAVELDWTLDRHTIALIEDGGGERRARASGYPRPVPGVAPERNLRGLSFAVANVTGILARAHAGHSRQAD
jgi:subtilisin family serine protease